MSMAVHYDEHQFAGRHQHPVHVEYGAGGAMHTHGIAFEDYTRMSTSLKHKPRGGRRSDAPVWAMDDAKLRAVMVRSLELRARLDAPQQGTEKDRLARAQRALQADNATLVDRLKKMAAQYVQLKAAPDVDAEQVAKMEEQIESVDTVLRTNAAWAEKVVAIVYRYYRLGEDSVAVAQAVGLKPPHVRQTLWRLQQTWEELQGNTDRVRRTKQVQCPSCGCDLWVKPGSVARRCDNCVHTPKPPKMCEVCGCEIQPGPKGKPTRSPHCVPCRRHIDLIRQRIKKRKPPVSLCSPECRAIYKDQHQPHPVVPVEQFGHEMEVARASGDSPSYRAYLAGCARVGVRPMLHDQWICSVEKMLGQYGLLG